MVAVTSMNPARLKLLPVFFILTGLLAVAPLQAQTIRGHGSHGGHGGHGGHAYHGHGHGGYYPYYPYSYFGFYYGYPYSPYSHGYPYPYSYGPYGGPYAYYGAPSADVGWIDTDVSPEKAMVYVDGTYVGVADNFDGYPGFLALKPGRHTITFKAPERQTFTRKVDVPAGAMLNFDFTLAKPSKGTEPAGTDLELDPEEEVIAPPPYGDPGDREEVVDQEEPPASLKLQVSPPDASIYIDGEFIGTASSLRRLHGSLRLDSGRHVVEVARPGYRTESREVKLAPGERSSLEIALQRD